MRLDIVQVSLCIWTFYFTKLRHIKEVYKVNKKKDSSFFMISFDIRQSFHLYSSVFQKWSSIINESFNFVTTQNINYSESGTKKRNAHLLINSVCERNLWPPVSLRTQKGQVSKTKCHQSLSFIIDDVTGPSKMRYVQIH